MKLFPWAHATHPQWPMAAGLVLAQLRALMARPQYASNPTLALLYITDHYADHAQDILDHLSAELPEVIDWAGTVGVGVCASGVEYIDEPAMAVLLCAVPPDQYRVYSGVAPLGTGDGMGFEPHSALVHADASTPELAEMLGDLAARLGSRYLFGGLASSRGRTVQFAAGGNGNMRGQGAARGVFSGGLSGVAFAEPVAIVSRVTQGCQPVGRERLVTAADGNVLLALDGEPALDVLLRERSITLERPQEAIAVLRSTLAGLASPGDKAIGRGGSFGADVRVRHIIGLDPGRRGVAIADAVETGAALAFCERNAKAARADLMRICAEIREELEPQETSLPVGAALAAPEPGADPHAARGIAGAVYVSCAGRGGPHFGGPSAELQWVKHALGDVPLVGFFAGGEIAHHHLYGYTGVLSVFTRQLNSVRR